MDVSIEPVNRETLPLLDDGLRALARHMDDPFSATLDGLDAALFSDRPSCHALVARRKGAQKPLGIALYSPVFSTVRGGAGIYVSDLWVDDVARGRNLGRRLVAEVVRHGSDIWGAGFLRLAAYNDNHDALAAYARMGFERVEGEIPLRLAGSAFERIAAM
ncbi:GNAT family N-acetyltransferase [Roseovarius sp. SCSIO 43702]|uniref:GNAT family N-acetyltransferase n=1 Tax=Roseovarius sp. SCSIO 43702 TaxID=2823043 RepID=UPI001C738536|nr:GNAT family N-acetyltransferase [Roseovarius sp. SCSIO 43702]QYX58135.1 GNAT family N-acetyltransferase [Roseovarius sp. SCSIO 43702]